MKASSWVRRALRGARSDQSGVTLIEVVISVALMGVLGMSLLAGLSGVALGQGKHDEQVGAVVAGRNHLETIKQAAYDSSITATPGPGYASLPTQRTVGNIVFDMEIVAQQLETGVQLVTVVVRHAGKEINRLQDYKVDR